MYWLLRKIVYRPLVWASGAILLLLAVLSGAAPVVPESSADSPFGYELRESSNGSEQPAPEAPLHPWEDTPTPIPTWGSVEGNSVEAHFGNSVASAGDVNGDGFTDVIIGAPKLSNGNTYEGAAFVFPGSSRGLLVVPVWRVESSQDGAQFGYSVSSAGDVNNDGYSDVVVGANLFDNGQSNEGQARLFLGSASGLSTTAAWTAESDQADSWFGWQVGSAGDVNGDGFSDVIVSAQYYNSHRGRAYVFHGDATGLATTAAWSVIGEPNAFGEPRFGSSVAGAGDVNGDGFSDVIVGANQFTNCPGCTGAAYIFLGSATGLSTSYATRLAPGGGQYFGTSVASAGDVDADGFSDVIVGDDGADTPQGRAYVFRGSASGVQTTASWVGSAAGTITRNDAYYGACVASAGDINDDGYSDVIVGATYLSNQEVWEGGAYIYLGSASGLQTTAVIREESNQADGRFGISVASAGDVNADGSDDVLAGASGISNGQFFEGRSYLYSDFSQFKPTPTPTPTPTATATPVGIYPGSGNLPPPATSVTGNQVVVTAPQLSVQLPTAARNKAIRKLMKLGMSRQKAEKRLTKFSLLTIFSVKKAAAPALGDDELEPTASSYTRRTKRNSVTISKLPAASYVASYRVVIYVGNVPLGSTKQSEGALFTIEPSSPSLSHASP